MPVTFGEHFETVIFAAFVGPLLYGCVLTVLAMAVAWFRGNAARMARLGMMSIVGACVIAFIGFFGVVRDIRRQRVVCSQGDALLVLHLHRGRDDWHHRLRRLLLGAPELGRPGFTTGHKGG